ncbi:MAG: hypothetical protein ACXWDI_08510 [Nocardioides sp.]
MRRLKTAAPGRPSRVVLHIGAPLAGTAYLRDILTRNRRRLTRYGVLYPTNHVGADSGHLDAVLDVLGLGAPGGRTTTGAWDRLTQAARDWRRGTVIVSHELFADADEDQVARIVGDFGSVEVHVVYVARDLGRQLPLAWQEWVRNGGTATFESYVDRVASRDGHRLSRVFWRSHDVADVLGRWAAVVPGGRIHVVTAPAGSDQDEALWGRFARAVGIESARMRAGSDTDGHLDAVAATEAARLLNVAGSRRVPPELLAAVDGVPPTLLEHHAGWVGEESERSIEALKRGGYDVVGDVTDLRPGPEAWTADPARMHPSAEDVVRAQTVLLGALLHRS